MWLEKLQGVFVFNAQGHGMHGHGETVHIAFPFDEEDLKAGESLLCKKKKRFPASVIFL